MVNIIHKFVQANICVSYKNATVWIKLMFLKELVLIKQEYQKKYMFCHYWYFKDVGFKFERHVCNKYHDVLIAA